MRKLRVEKGLVLLFFVSFLFLGFSGAPGNTSGGGDIKKVPITGNTAQLKFFFDALKDSKNKNVRIGHWGDSIILGDVLSDNIRVQLQQKFGGSGVGFISLVPEDAPMRTTTSISSSNDWTEASIFKRNPKKYPLGLNASVFTPKSSLSWVNYEVGKFNKSVKGYTSVNLFYTSGNSSAEVTVSTNTGFSKKFSLESGSSVRKKEIEFPNTVSSIRFEFKSCQGVLFYGVSLENSPGVYLDNFPIKGNNGIGLQDIPVEVLSDFNSLMNYKLLVLNFGVNVLSPEHKDYTWYITKMEKVINQIQSIFKNTSILLVGTGDKAVKKRGEFVSEPNITELIKAQQEIANRTGIAYWNLFEAMGGENSIVDWVNQNPPLAYKDYCHFTPDGGEQVADLITEALLKLQNK